MKKRDLSNYLNNYAKKHFEPNDNYEHIAKKAGVNNMKENKKSSRKWILRLSTFCALGLIIFTMIYLFAINGPTAQATTKVQIDINPSFELIVNEDNKVESIIGLNDEGKMLLLDEEIVGKNIDDALNRIIELVTNAGFLQAGKNSITIDENKISITISNENEKDADTICTKIENKVKQICEKLNVDTTIEMIKDFQYQKMLEYALKCDPTLNIDEAKKMSYQELLNVIRLYHLEIAELCSENLVEMYLSIKEYEFHLVEKDYIQSVIKTFDQGYQQFLERYQELYQQLDNAKQKLNDAYFENYISSESSYQKILTQFQQAKNELLKIKQEIASLEPGDLRIIALEMEYSAKKVFIDSVINNLNIVNDLAKATVNGFSTTIDHIMNEMKDFESKLPTEISTTLNEQVENLDKALNKFKDECFQKFEDQYGEEIANARAKLKSMKESLLK